MLGKIVNKIKAKFNARKIAQFKKYEKIDGWLTPAEANGLFEIATLLSKDATVLEIGSWKGKSTWCIAQGVKNGNIHCIDPFNAAGEEGSVEIYDKTKGDAPLIEQFKENLSNVPGSVKIIPHKGYSNEFVGAVKNIDFLFIDGDHSIEGCKYDYNNFAGDIKSGGYLAFHDYDPERHDLGPTWVIENEVKKNNAFRLYNRYDSLCVFLKN